MKVAGLSVVDTGDCIDFPLTSGQVEDILLFVDSGKGFRGLLSADKSIYRQRSFRKAEKYIQNLDLF